MSDPVFIIAEAGVNHNGDDQLAFDLVDAAAAAGADAVKFQTFTASALATQAAPKAVYQVRTTGDAESLFAMLKKLELSRDMHIALQTRCAEKGIAFLSSPFDRQSLRFLVDDLGLETIKIPSGELTNGPLLVDAARAGVKLILSTGMSNLDEIKAALEFLAFAMLEPTGDPTPSACAKHDESQRGRDILLERVTLLQCTTDYPTLPEMANLAAMQTFRDAFGLKVGFSDHTDGTVVPIAAAALGACIVEKHFTLDRSLPGPDHEASLEPQDFAALVSAIRDVEVAIGTGVKVPFPTERTNIPVARKSLVALVDIDENTVFDETNLGIKRPGDGVSPMQYWTYIGTPAQRRYAAGEKIEP